MFQKKEIKKKQNTFINDYRKRWINIIKVITYYQFVIKIDLYQKLYEYSEKNIDENVFSLDNQKYVMIIN
jgi:chromosome segregation and condensation protein ScpB